jgi:hypothetical protein
LNNSNPTSASVLPSHPVEKLQALVVSLRTLVAASGKNRHDQAINAVCAMIAEGVDTRWQIIAVLRNLGFNVRHANIVLDGGTKTAPLDVPWRLDAETGRYRLAN